MANKDKIKMEEERRLRQEAAIALSLKKSKLKEKKYLTFILEKVKNEISNPHNSSSVSSLYKKWSNKDRDIFVLFLKTIDSQTDLVSDKYIDILARLFDFKLFWANNMDTINIKTKNINKQLELLINHLFSKYKLPSFALNIWNGTYFRSNEFDWFMHIAEGNNLKNAPKLPFEITKKMAHHTNSAPADYTFIQAMVWGLLTQLECSVPLKKEICAHPVSLSGSRMEFWQSIFVFLRENTMLDLDQVRPLMDFISHLKYSNNAPLPNFSIKGRNPAQLLDQMGEWHRETARVQAEQQRNQRQGKSYKKIDYKWEIKYHPWNFSEGHGENKRNWLIEELNSSEKLREEGSELRHCVASYDQKCHAGNMSIFSLTLNNKKKYTIELRDSTIHQVRGKANVKIDPVSKRVLERWADKFRFTIASSL